MLHGRNIGIENGGVYGLKNGFRIGDGPTMSITINHVKPRIYGCDWVWILV